MLGEQIDIEEAIEEAVNRDAWHRAVERERRTQEQWFPKRRDRRDHGATDRTIRVWRA